MSIELKVPVLPESVSDATIASWHKKAGDAVKRDENLVDLETDKVVLEVPAPVDGVLKEIRHEVGDTVNSEQVIAIIEEGATAAAPAPAAAALAPAAAAPAPAASKAAAELSPAAQRVATESKVDTSAIAGTGRDGRIIKEDVVNAGSRPAAAPAAAPAAKPTPGVRPEERVPMTRMRARIAERLMQSKNSIAMLTSFNEVNLAEVVKMRKALGDAFQKEHGIKLGFMSFFVKAAAEALKRYPFVNASVDGNDVIYHGYQDISIAVSTDKGLVTPVLRDVQDMSFADVEKGIADYATKARANKLSLDDLQGGTFTITNGGTFGSLLSTPIVNPPQSAFLDRVHAQDRALRRVHDQGTPHRRERPDRRRADDVHRAQLRPPHHRRQGRGAVPGRHQEPAGESAADAVGSVIA